MKYHEIQTIYRNWWLNSLIKSNQLEQETKDSNHGTTHKSTGREQVGPRFEEPVHQLALSKGMRLRGLWRLGKGGWSTERLSNALTYHMSIHFSRFPCELGTDMHLFSPVEINYCIIWYHICTQSHWTAAGTSTHVCKWLRFACFVNTTATVNSSLSGEGSTLLPRFINGTAFLAHFQLLPAYKYDRNSLDNAYCMWCVFSHVARYFLSLLHHSSDLDSTHTAYIPCIIVVERSWSGF